MIRECHVREVADRKVREKEPERWSVSSTFIHASGEIGAFILESSDGHWAVFEVFAFWLDLPARFSASIGQSASLPKPVVRGIKGDVIIITLEKVKFTVRIP